MARWSSLPGDLPPEVVGLIARLRTVKDVSELTLAALASRTAYSRSAWERYLNGKRHPPREAVRALASVTDPEQVKPLLLAWERATDARAQRDSTPQAAPGTSPGTPVKGGVRAAVAAGARPFPPPTLPLGRPLRVGFVAAEAAMPYTQCVLAEYRRLHPESVVEVRSVDFCGQVDALLSGRVDAAFVRPPLPSCVQILPLALEPRVVCLPAHDPLLARQPLHLADLAGRVFVDVAGDGMRAWWDHWQINPRPDGSRVPYGPVVTDIEPLLLAVSQGEGIALVPAAARHLYPRPGVAYADLMGAPAATAALAWLPGPNGHPGVTALCEVARRVRGCLA